jgi:hypothetical protein
MIHHGAQILSRETLDAALEDIPAVTSYRHEELRDIA